MSEGTSSREDREDDEEYIVEAIRSWRYNLNEKKKEYFIKWEKYPETDNTWEPEEHLTHCPDIMKEFVDNLSPDQSKYFRVEQPQKLTGFQRNATFLERAGVDGPHESDDEDSAKEKRQKFYILARFHDSNYAEEVTLDELLKYLPEEAMEFCEERLLYRKESVSRDCDTSNSARLHD